jgi:hypothetical protein
MQKKSLSYSALYSQEKMFPMYYLIQLSFCEILIT